MKRRQFEYKGYKGLPNIAKALGVSPNTLKSRIARGDELEHAIEKILAKKTLQKVAYEYKGIKGIPNIAQAFDVNEGTIYYRMSKGMTIEQALGPKALNNPMRSVQKGWSGKPDLHPLWQLALGISL